MEFTPQDFEDQPEPKSLEDNSRSELKSRTAFGIKELGFFALVIAATFSFFLFNPANIEATKADGATLPVAKTATEADTQLTLCAKFLEKNISCLVSWEFSDSKEQGALISQTPASGEVSDLVKLVYSRGATAGKVPLLSGLTITEAKELLWSAGLQLGKITYKKSATPKDIILSTAIEAGKEAKNQSSIDVTVSSGEITVPDWKGKTKEIVESEAANLDIKVEFREKPNKGPIGIVLEQSIIGNTDYTQTVVVVISSAEKIVEGVEVPDVVGLTKDEAVSALAAAGFLKITINGSESATDEKKKEQKVQSVSPKPGDKAPSDAEIILNLS